MRPCERPNTTAVKRVYVDHVLDMVLASAIRDGYIEECEEGYRLTEKGQREYERLLN